MLKIENIIPAHFTTSKDNILYTGEGDSDGPVYKNKEELFDENFLKNSKLSDFENIMEYEKMHMLRQRSIFTLPFGTSHIHF